MSSNLKKDVYSIVINSFESIEDIDDRFQKITIDDFCSYIDSIVKDRIEKERIIEDVQSNFQSYAVRMLSGNIPSNDFIDILKNFTNFETGIIYSLILGVPLEIIANAYGTSVFRIEQAIYNIRYNPVWKVIHGSKEKA